MAKYKIHSAVLKSRFGTRLPAIMVMPNGDGNFRAFKAELLQIAADLETASTKTDKWAVVVDDCNVHLELSLDSDDELARGLDVIHRVIIDRQAA